ncbi:MAG: hypothetical protein KGH57_03795 [Candidatus Micrarchaeota archaeon]|nr:hypothetical protein [Candidatus Micrarchaeota archaeon]
MAADVSVEASTIVFLVLSSVLAFYLTRNYLAERKRNYLYWSAGMWIFALSDLLEVLFAFGVYSQAMAQFYLFVTALLVIPLAMGSLELIKSRLAKNAYLGYSLVAAAALAYVTFTSQVSNFVTDSVVNGNAPVNVIILSSFITFPALIIIVAIAALSYMRTKRKKVIWIILGMLTFAFGGILYVASFPASIYYTEFAGLVMLWLGFFDFSMLKRR